MAVNKLKLRKNLIYLHALVAAFFLPGFLLVAMTGGNYLMGNKGQVTTTPIEMPADVNLDFQSANLKADLQALIASADLNLDFQYVKVRDSSVQTRPTSRPYLQVDKVGDGYVATLNTPNLQAAMMELHKGHGPTAFKFYQKLMALGLLIVVIGGFIVGILARNYRPLTLGSFAVGAVVIFSLALL